MNKKFFDRLQKLHGKPKQKPAVRPTQFKGFERLHKVLDKALGKDKRDVA